MKNIANSNGKVFATNKASGLDLLFPNGKVCSGQRIASGKKVQSKTKQS